MNRGSKLMKVNLIKIYTQKNGAEKHAEKEADIRSQQHGINGII